MKAIFFLSLILGCNTSDDFRALQVDDSDVDLGTRADLLRNEVIDLCENPQLNEDEKCDTTTSKTCIDLGFQSGVLTCTKECTFDTSACLHSEKCGNEVIDEQDGEECDGKVTETCSDRGFLGGNLECSDSCRLDTSNCIEKTVSCGDNLINGEEECDGTALGGNTCETMGFSSGPLSCSNCELDTSQCSTCGNGIIEGPEECDRVDVGNSTCTTILGSPAYGHLSCRADCKLESKSCELTTIDISAGAYFSCKILSNGSIICGGAPQGALSTPNGKFVQISVGFDHACARREDQTVSCWISPNSQYPKVANVPATISKTHFISSGSNYNCAINLDNSISCWGDNNVMKATPPTGSYKSVATGLGDHTCAIDSNDRIKCWGWGDFGQTEPPLGSYKGIAVGNLHSCAVNTGGEIKCWGISDDRILVPPGKYEQVTTGPNHTCAILTNKSVKCWQNGSKTLSKSTPPLGKFKKISAGLAHTCGIKTDGQSLCWGDSRFFVP